MRLIAICIALVLSFNVGLAQDTITVQTLTFDDITQRRGDFVFPDADLEFRKILMYYTLKCDPQTTQDNFDCGEWDYLTYNFVYDHTGELDSNLIEHPSFYVGTATPETFGYQFNPLYNYYQSWQLQSVIDSIISEWQVSVGSGMELSNFPFSNANEPNRNQYLWTADELTTAGLSAGAIQRMAMETTSGNIAWRELEIRMANVTGNVLTEISDSPEQTVYHQYVDIHPDSLHFFNFTEAFEWDGTSSVLVEINTWSTDENNGPEILSDNAPEFTSWNVSGPDGFIEFPANQFVNIPVSGESFDDEITVSLWAYGDPESLPANTYLFEAFNAEGQRALNVHLPWANGRVYWDAGQDNGYDRIDKQATASEYSGQWNHWAFTKNGGTGEMSIYLNGTLWHSGTDLYRPVGDLHQFNLGKGVNSNNGFPGKIDEFRVWKKALDGATIAEWMHRTIDNTHPNYNDLAVYYDFDDNETVTDQSGNGMDGIIFGAPVFGQWPANALNKNATLLNERPQITFANGEYISHIDSVMATDTVLQAPVSVVEYIAIDNVLEELQNNWHWPEGCSYWWSPEGVIVDSLCYAAESELVNDEVAYFGPAYEVIDRWEIGRFITPYGINLDLGPEGFTWVYDVTDYAHLLRDTVDLQMGNQQELIDVQFKMITGTPSREVLQVDKVWGDMASHSYANLDNDVVLSETSIDLLPQTDGLMLKTRLTGHGHHSNTGNYPHCCEWKDNTHYLFVNGSEEEDWKIWQTDDCALNPVYPQGGTWPGAREGWCPGDLVKENDFDLSNYANGSAITLDYDITPVPSNNQGMGSGNYVIAMHLFQYAAMAHSHDAELYNVINPSKMQYYSRHNPICREPRVVIRNAGSAPLTSATITYGVSGGESETFEWTGNLNPMEKEMVTLPVPNMEFWEGNEEAVFEANISQPNGQADQNASNDNYYSPFNMPEEYPHDFIIWYKTNNYPHQNSFTVKDLSGEVVFEQNSFTPLTTYRDTMDLSPGCYTFKFLDTGNDGLSYWANSAQGTGYLRFKNNGGPVLKNFEAEFGHSVMDAFFVGDVTSVYDNSAPEPRLNIFPNPGTGAFSLEINRFSGSCVVEIFSPQGKRISSEQVVVPDYLLHHFDLENQPAGVYLVKIYNDEFQTTRKVVLK